MPLTSNEKKALHAARNLYEAIDLCIGTCDTTSTEEMEASPLLTKFRRLVFNPAPHLHPEELANELEKLLAEHKEAT